MHLEPVQKWVLSILAATTIVHLAGGLVIAAMYVDDDRTDAQVGLNVLAGAFGVIAVAGVPGDPPDEAGLGLAAAGGRPDRRRSLAHLPLTGRLTAADLGWRHG